MKHVYPRIPTVCDIQGEFETQSSRPLVTLSGHLQQHPSMEGVASFFNKQSGDREGEDHHHLEVRL